MGNYIIKHIGYDPESYFNHEEITNLNEPFTIENIVVEGFSATPVKIGKLQRQQKKVVLIPSRDITAVLLMQDKEGDNYALQADIERPAPLGVGYTHPLLGGLSRFGYKLLTGHDILVRDHRRSGQIHMEPSKHTAVLYDNDGHAGTVRVEPTVN